MTDKRFHLAWFCNFTPDEWRDPFGQGGRPWDGEFYMDMARMLERDCFDFVLFEDKRLPLVSFRLAFQSGDVNDPKGKTGLTSAVASMLTEVRSILAGPSIQARCIECPPVAPARIEKRDLSLLGLLKEWLS